MKKQIVQEGMLLGGKWQRREETIEVFDPGNGQCVATVPKANAEDMREAIQQAKNGARVAKDLPIHKRQSILMSVASYIEEHKTLFAETIVLESSKTITEARREVGRCIETIRLSAEEARRITGETIPFSQMPGHESRIGYISRCPIGIIAAITPFNDPLNLVAHKVGPAIASGNAVIVKPSSETPLSAIRLAEAFMEAGLPDGILSVITGSGREVGDELITSDDVRFVSFTGGFDTGEAITRKAGVKKMAMELGSNAPTIILSDADLDEAIHSTVSGAFGVAGQNCIGVQRIYVEQSVYYDFTEKFIEVTKRLKVGDKREESTDIGPMISEREARRVKSWIGEACQKGATLHCGGERKGAYLTPAVLTNVGQNEKVVKEEIFGPVVVITPVESLMEATRLANDSCYGLQAGIFTSNLESAFYAIQELEVGGVMVNDSSDVRIDGMPFGGVKRSGLGREGIKYAIDAMTEEKVVSFKLKR
ncbi:aldehyde dehydrogenase family protein [Alkalihalophilus lindianensis]|uniref:Aldehyde dehydrogenase family protein n=1 Tax=Alkalihalophilus lindianensis TaxID=1630542 RepID=A0ABU3X7Y1_9BACI|nr:aldehyde dehydrogenase family protein [Alkalihalophilus lindianensis]MDV2683549.1 aldehyde dehydrogenase family protein [Alkalihalophilus lindianensis]